MPVLFFRSKEAQFVEGIRARDKVVERAFFDYCKEYCLRSQGGDDFFADDRFQSAFLQIWTEIQDGRIFLQDGVIFRKPKAKDAVAARMTCSLRSFIVDICRNQQTKEARHSTVSLSSLHNVCDDDRDAFVKTEKEEKLQIIHVCIEALSPHCRDILIQFYVKGMKLDQILQRRSDNTSKDGLKTSKSKCMQRLRENVLSSYVATR